MSASSPMVWLLTGHNHGEITYPSVSVTLIGHNYKQITSAQKCKSFGDSTRTQWHGLKSATYNDKIYISSHVRAAWNYFQIKKQLSRSPDTSGSSDPVLLFPLLSFLPGNSRMMSMLISVEVEIWAAGAPGLHHKLFPLCVCVCVWVRWDEQAHPH